MDNTIKVHVGEEIYKGVPVEIRSDGKAYNMSDVLGVAVESTPKKKRRFDMFGKKKKVDKVWYDLNRRVLELETSDKTQDDQINNLIDKESENRMNIKHHMDEITDLKADVHELKYPMGEIELCDRSCYISGGMGIYKPTEFCYQYIFGNKKYIISEINRNITGYRKQGDFVQIRWVEEHEGTTSQGNSVRHQSVHTNTFLLKDELIPLPDCTVDFLSDFIEVK